MIPRMWGIFLTIGQFHTRTREEQYMMSCCGGNHGNARFHLEVQICIVFFKERRRLQLQARGYELEKERNPCMRRASMRRLRYVG